MIRISKQAMSEIGGTVSFEEAAGQKVRSATTL
jgi:hypothetical protein